MEIINAIALIVPKLATGLTVDLSQLGWHIGASLGAAPGELSSSSSPLLQFSGLQKTFPINQKILF